MQEHSQFGFITGAFTGGKRDSFSTNVSSKFNREGFSAFLCGQSNLSLRMVKERASGIAPSVRRLSTDALPEFLPARHRTCIDKKRKRVAQERHGTFDVPDAVNTQDDASVIEPTRIYARDAMPRCFSEKVSSLNLEQRSASSAMNAHKSSKRSWWEVGEYVEYPTP